MNALAVRAAGAAVQLRSTRVLRIGLGCVAVATVLLAVAPVSLLLFGPIALGVPHLAADVRYLIVRGPASMRRSTVAALAAPLVAIVALRAIDLLGGPPAPTAQVMLGFGAIVVAAALAPDTARRPWILLGTVAIAAIAIAAPHAALLVLLHVHNLIALAIWLAWTRPSVRPVHRLAIVAAILGVTLIILVGGLDLLPRSPSVGRLGPALAPGLDAELAYRVVLAYAFLQAIHYVVWLRLIPVTQSRPASTLRTNLVSLRRDLGSAGLVLLMVATLAVPIAAALSDAARVRDVYLALATFHAWLELAVIAYMLASRQRLQPA